MKKFNKTRQQKIWIFFFLFFYSLSRVANASISTCPEAFAALSLKQKLQNQVFDLEVPLLRHEDFLDAVAIRIEREGRFLMSFRKVEPLSNTFGHLGGKLEFGESIANAARREVLEEGDIRIEDLRFLFVTSSYVERIQKKFRIFVIRAGKFFGEPRNAEPHKSHFVDWINPREVRGPFTSATEEDLQRLGFNH